MARIVITGAAGALGSAVVNLLAGQGHQVVGLYRKAADAPAGVAGYAADLTDAAAVDAVFAQIRTDLGPIDALVNIAGGFRWQTLADGDPATWERMFALNLSTAVNACRAALPDLIQTRGAVVNIGAAGAVKAGAGMGAYAASKAGVAKLTESLAEEVKADGVRVNAVLPSIIDTAANRADMPDADVSAWVSPDSLAGVIAFLISPAASDITGALIAVTGRV